MVYRVWDTDSANLVADCATVEEALRAIQRAVGVYGPTVVKTWALEREDDQGTVTVLAEGDDLAWVAVEDIPA